MSVRPSVRPFVGRSRKHLKCAKRLILTRFFIPRSTFKHYHIHFYSFINSFINSYIYSFSLQKRSFTNSQSSEAHLLTVTWPCFFLSIVFRCTRPRIYQRVCQSVRLSISLSVDPSVRNACLINTFLSSF